MQHNELADDAAGPDAQRRDCGEGASPSNTAPANSMNGK